MATDGLTWLARYGNCERNLIGLVSGWILDHTESRRIRVECHPAPIHGRDGSVSGTVLVLRQLPG